MREIDHRGPAIEPASPASDWVWSSGDHTETRAQSLEELVTFDMISLRGTALRETARKTAGR
jgi:hypothetical protein